MDSDIRLLWIENDDGYRELLAEKLAAAAGIELLAAVGTAAEFREKLASSEALDVALLDIHLNEPDGTLGVDLVPEIRDEHPGAKLAILSNHAESDNAFLGRAYQAGVEGFIHKQESSAVILDRIRALHAGQDPFVTSPRCRDAVERLLKPFRSETDVWRWFDDDPELRDLVIAVAGSTHVLRKDFVATLPMHANTFNNRLLKIRRILRDRKVLGPDEALTFERLRDWARSKHFHFQ